MSESNAISLAELNQSIKFALKSSFPDYYWVTAEISSLMENRSGHCYLELTDKMDGIDKTAATARATIWASTYRLVKSAFEHVTQQPLGKGLKVLVQVEVSFHEVYGLSLNVVDIDPSYTLGDLAKKRLEIIQRLKDDGVFDMNKELEMARLPKTIAVISSPTAAGFGDFMNQMTGNAYGYKFHIKLFAAQMQGDKTADSIIRALDRIYPHAELFDAVAIIRGGGSQGDLSYFDNYDLAANVAQFPLPILTGIGHERDNSITDMVAHTCLKTPTAVAAFFIDRFNEEEQALTALQADFSSNTLLLLNNHAALLNRLSQQFVHLTHSTTASQKQYFALTREKINGLTQRFFESQKHTIKNNQQNISTLCKNLITQETFKLNLAEKTMQLVNPAHILKRGYSITRLNGKVVTDCCEIPKGSVIETITHDGRIVSTVESTHKDPSL